MQPGDVNNRMWFNTKIRDAFGMPQPTFEYLPTPKAAVEAHDMMTEYVEKTQGIQLYH